MNACLNASIGVGTISIWPVVVCHPAEDELTGEFLVEFRDPVCRNPDGADPSENRRQTVRSLHQK